MLHAIVSLAQTTPTAPTPVSWLAHNFGWIKDLFTGDSVAHAVLMLALVTAFGLMVGTLRIFRVSLGIAGVLFIGLAFGHFGLTINDRVMEFAREFGLILFVYTIGLQVGPGFLASLRKAGLRLNMLAAAVVLLGTLLTVATIKVTAHWGDRRIEVPEAVGLLSGAATNTPSLAAAQQTIKDAAAAADGRKKGPDAATLPGTACAIAYPFGTVGLFLVLLAIRFGFRVDVAKENELMSKLSDKPAQLARVNLEVTNPNLDYLPIGAVPLLNEPGVVVSRVLQGGKPYVAAPDTIIHVGDVLHVVGPQERLEQLKVVIGRESKIDVTAVPSDIVARRMVVTRTAALGKSLEELDLTERFGVTITRVSRADIEIPATPQWRFQFGDQALVVGTESGIQHVAALLGDSVKKLDHPQIIPVFVGIALGVLLGSWPLAFPGMPVPVKLGLAGGPMLVAIILARIGQIGKLSWFMPRSANFALRELGIALFLACVGIKSGEGFVHTLVAGNGLYWMMWAAMITVLPPLIVGAFARIVYKTNFVALCGLLSGSMTAPPALAFSNAMAGAENSSVAYATVYPLTMILRVICAQAIVLLFW